MTKTEEFIKKADGIFKGLYDYSYVNYINNKTRVKIGCKKHGFFYQEPRNHLSGKGCPYCASNKKLNLDKFIELSKKVHGDKYDYSRSKYVNVRSKINITCKTHGEFWQNARSHMGGSNCPECVRESRYLDKSVFLDRASKIHNNLYDYKDVIYKGVRNKVTINCKVHGPFSQIAWDHLHGCGCPICSSSTLEKEVRTFLESNFITYSEQMTWDWLVYKKSQKVDFYLPEFNTAIECQGIQHFEPVDFFGGESRFNEQVEKDSNKKSLCNNHNVKLVYFSNLSKIYGKYNYTYKVFENLDDLISEIRST